MDLRYFSLIHYNFWTWGRLSWAHPPVFLQQNVDIDRYGLYILPKQGSTLRTRCIGTTSSLIKTAEDRWAVKTLSRWVEQVFKA